jgi:actin-related protein 6
VRPFWEYHHCVEKNEQGTANINRTIQYLISLVSKVFSDLMLLKSRVDLQTLVTYFLPQLHSNKSKIKWENITLEMLAGYLASIPLNSKGPPIF